MPLAIYSGLVRLTAKPTGTLPNTINNPRLFHGLCEGMCVCTRVHGIVLRVYVHTI